VRRRW